MMDKVAYDTRVWHLLYHSAPTPDSDPISHHTNPMNQIGPGWATVQPCVTKPYQRLHGGVRFNSGSTVRNGGYGGGGGR